MNAHISYLKYVIRHKWFVLLAGLSLRVPLWQLIMHDWDKFLPDEWFPYVNTFYKDDGSSQYVESDSFARAWLFHQKRNKHHWQYWMLTYDRGNTIALDMPINDLREMLADWIGAGRALGFPDTKAWYVKNKDNMTLSAATRHNIENFFDVYEVKK